MYHLKNKALYIIIVAVISIVGVSLLAIYKENGTNIQEEIQKENKMNSSQSKSQEPIQIKPVVETAEESGPIIGDELLWEKEQKFMDLQKEHNAYVRMAAFRTVLPDPLPGEEYNVAIAADMLAGSVILPGQILSQNNIAGPYTKQRGFREGPTYSGANLITTIGGGVCKIASTLYNVGVLADLHIVERHNHSMIVPYVPVGQDATVSYGSYDIKLKNDKSFPIILWARSKGNVLYMAIYGSEKPPKVTWHHETLNTTDTYTINKNNPNLPKGVTKVVLEGYKGYTMNSWLTIEMPDGTVKTKQLGTDTYRPMPRLVEIGVGAVVE